ncbi:hypothetical protein C8Q79DRAFT_1000768 [Trametes meyenii]|nr:hypothetical protein C8Q79DRAFT_1000768 [Trametes meyenii]
MPWFFQRQTDGFPVTARSVHRQTGEKTKWVPIPPEELQFERPSRPHQPKTRPQHADRHSRQSGGPSGSASISSGQGSQQQSRTHSSAGMRPPPSHAGSVSHSQAQSRTGSVHSSPRHSSVRGGGRRLPDEAAPGIGASRSIRSSGPNSPAMFAQPQPLPPQEFIPAVRPFPGRDLSSLGTIPDQGIADAPPPGAFYSPVPPLGVSPYHSPRPAGSPAHNPYALPPMGFPGQQSIPAPVPAPGYGTPPYPMYPPPYPYGYGQPYMYWAPPGAQPSPSGPVPSPMVHPIQSSDGGVPPPTMIVRPLPPNESEALAGYREVGITLPPAPAPSQSQPDEGVERGPRARELSFGTIAAAGASTPSPAPGSPSVGAVTAGAALGLDVGGDQVSASGMGEAQKADEVAAADSGEKTGSKAFTGFSIGIGPGEPGPARLRSRTRTQSKGAVVSVSELVEASDKEAKGEAGGAVGTNVDAFADVAAAVIDLTEKETKWEFGTTKQQEESGSSEDAAAALPPTVDVLGADPSTLPPLPGVPFISGPAPYAGAPPFVPPVVIPGGPINGVPSAPSPSTYTLRHPASGPEHDEWEVRDYGYGFGRGGPPPPSAYSPRDDRSFRDRPDFQPSRDHHNNRPRRGSHNQGGFERGGFGGRRGRGLGGGYGGRGYANRSFSGGRGGYANQGQHRQPPYVPPPPPPPDATTYYVPPMAPLPPYVPAPYDPYAFVPIPPPPPPPQGGGPQGSAPPPLPVPQSALTYPLDSTRYYLLGQLEYYLSPQNMAQDFFLRQQMDSRGWIPIQLIASFNRVRTLTTEAHLVAEVLALSTLVEVHNSHVRMRQWQQFVLPTARRSVVEPDNGAPSAQESTVPTSEEDAAQSGEHRTALQNHQGDEDEEEEVEFVL